MCGVKTFQNFFYIMNNIRNSKSVVKKEIATNTHHNYDNAIYYRSQQIPYIRVCADIHFLHYRSTSL